MSPRTAFHQSFLALLELGVVSIVLATCVAGEPRLIATGWDSPTPARFRAELSAFEAWQAFDGTTIAATRKLSDGRVADARNVFGREPWQWSDFSDALSDLQAVKPVRATENFLFVYANPGDVDWMDDDGWSQVVDHWRLLARLAKQAGLRGVLYDAEPYTPPYSQFLYRAQPGTGQHSFAEYEAKARQRGREVIQAVTDEYPDITIMTYRLFCDLLPAVDSGNVAAAIQSSPYGLQPGFVNGWLDVAPPTLRIVDGNEDAYRFNSPADFNQAFVRLKLLAAGFVSEELRGKFRMQYDVGHGIYLDAHVNPPASPWFIDRLGGTSAQRLAANVAAALAASDGYVWIYGEQGRWWPGGSSEYPMWPEKLAGADRALQRASRPIEFARRILADPACGPNLLQAAAFDAAASDGTPTGWWTWQDDQSSGKLQHQEGTAHAQQVGNGVFGQLIPVTPGQTYVVQTRLRSAGRGFASLVIGWKTADGRWTAHASRYQFAARDADPQDTWQEVLGLVQVPEDAGQIVFMLGAEGQLSDADQAWFDDCRLTLLDLVR